MGPLPTLKCLHVPATGDLVKLALKATPSSVDDTLAEVYVGNMVVTRILGKSSSW